MKTLTERAIDILNGDFGSRNPYSISQMDWIKYDKRIEMLKRRLRGVHMCADKTTLDGRRR